MLGNELTFWNCIPPVLSTLLIFSDKTSGVSLVKELAFQGPVCTLILLSSTFVLSLLYTTFFRLAKFKLSLRFLYFLSFLAGLPSLSGCILFCAKEYGRTCFDFFEDLGRSIDRCRRSIFLPELMEVFAGCMKLLAFSLPVLVSY